MKYILVLFTLFVMFLIGTKLQKLPSFLKNSTPTQNAVINKPLEKYSIENLASTAVNPGKLIVKDVIKGEEDFTSYLFEFEFNPNLDGKTIKKTTGQINIPKNSEKDSYPIVLMLRGYIDQKTYKTGDGTKNGAKFFAENGFITIAPDFLGYGGSDKEAENIFESRFQTHITALSLLRTIEAFQSNRDLLPDILVSFLQPTTNNSSSLSLRADGLQLFIWSHSNGGQVALTILEESKVKHPAVLWAPVSKPFPYSILYYTDDADDGGKFLRKELADFERLYDSDKYSLTKYFDSIEAPILLQQGTIDDAVPALWSDNLYSELKSKDKEIQLIKYPGADHNMNPLWNEAIQKDLEFYNSFLK